MQIKCKRPSSGNSRGPSGLEASGAAQSLTSHLEAAITSPREISGKIGPSLLNPFLSLRSKLRLRDSFPTLQLSGGRARIESLLNRFLALSHPWASPSAAPDPVRGL